MQTSPKWVRGHLVPVAVCEERAVPAWQGGARLEEAPVCLPEVRLAGKMLFKVVPSGQMLYTNWPSTGNSFEGAFGGYDDVSLRHPPCYCTAPSSC